MRGAGNQGQGRLAKRDFYEVLGVPKGADEAVLKGAYRKLAMQFHPDRNPGNAEAEHKFKEISEAYDFERVFMISAHKGTGVDDVRADLAKRMPAGPWLYPEDQLADVPMRFLAAEITREQVYRSLHDELPYAITVETENWKDQKDGSARIEQVIFVERDGQKKIVLGEKGQMIKRIGAFARKIMEEQFERRVHLFLFVKVREDWGDDPERYEAMGLDFPKK